jgi:hypothetical protein
MRMLLLNFKVSLEWTCHNLELTRLNNSSHVYIQQRELFSGKYKVHITSLAGFNRNFPEAF